MKRGKTKDEVKGEGNLAFSFVKKAIKNRFKPLTATVLTSSGLYGAKPSAPSVLKEF